MQSSEKFTEENSNISVKTIDVPSDDCHISLHHQVQILFLPLEEAMAMEEAAKTLPVSHRLMNIHYVQESSLAQRERVAYYRRKKLGQL